MASKLNDYLKSALLIIVLIQFLPPIIHNISKTWQNHKEPRNKVGYISINGAITCADTHRKYIHQFFKDPEIKAIFLNIESPGGAAGSAEALALDIMNLKKECSKPVIAYTENICASGGYYIASAADIIVAPASCVIGSIGARIATQFQLKELLANYHIKTNTIASGAYKTMLDPFTESTPEQLALLQSVTDDCYQTFVKDVAERRHLNIQDKHIWAEGKIFTGKQALDLKLIDALGSKSTAIEMMKKHLIPSNRKIDWVKPPKENTLQKFLKGNNADDDCDQPIEESLFDNFFAALFRQFRTQPHSSIN